MKTSKILIILVALVVATIAYYSIPTGPLDEDYAAAILKERKEKDEYMRRSDDSPFTEKDKFTGLKYFTPDPAYKVTAKLFPVDNKKVIVLSTSTGEEGRYLEYAWAAFKLNGVECKLLLLEVMAAGPTRGSLFLAFADETSANKTYGAGRYLDVKKIPGATSIQLDFNKAYNPYCAYTDHYSCPFPPRENILKIAIRAGEKSYH